jgi:amino acid adenylation domain-containing protein
MNEELNRRLARLSPEKRALLQLRLKQGGVACLPQPLPQKAHSSSAPLSFAQQRLWFLERLESNTGLYNIPWLVKIKGGLNVPALRQSLNALVVRQASLRTQFVSNGDAPEQRISESVDIQIEFSDLSGLKQKELDAEVHRRLEDAIHRPFNLSKDLMLRTLLLQTSPAEHILAIVFHHIAVDGWSISIFMRELSAYYSAFTNGEMPSLAELPVQYVDFAGRQRQEMRGARLARCLNYWKKQLEGAPELLELPTYQKRPALQSYSGAFESLDIPASLTRDLRKLGERENATVFMVLLASFYMVLARYSRQSDIVVGSPIAGRTSAETENVIGCFVNSLALRADLSGNPTFVEFLQRVRKVALDGYTHQDMPLEKLVEELQPRRSQSHPPLYQVMFALQNTPDEPLQLEGLTATPLPLPWKIAKFDLTLFIKEQDGALKATMEYCTALFKPEFVAGMLLHLKTLLAEIVANPARNIWEYPILPESEQKEQLASIQNDTSPPVTQCIHHIFEERARETPDATALVLGDATLSYGELNRRSNKLAHYLIRRGVGPDVLVGVCMDRSIELMVSLLAILKAGGAFVPLDANYPEERLRFMLQDTRTPVLLVHEHLRSKVPCDTEMLDVRDPILFSNESEENPACDVTPEHLAYVMYTSGSTGKPKGVCVPHRGVVRLVMDPNYVRLSRDEVLLQFAPVSFDASTFEIWGALLNGGKLVLCTQGPAALNELGGILERHRVTTLWLTSGLFNQMVDDHLDSLRGLKQLLAGGDALSVPHVRKAVANLNGCQLINGYGPTENTTFTCCHPVVAENTEASSIPIGRSINNTQIYVLDRCMNPVPFGVSGELYIGGEGLARGYHNRPDLTAQKFVPNPFESGTRLYRTGDNVRFLPDGTLEFLGRFDNQVKIRGFRIELGEIEAVLSQHPEIREALVLVRAAASGDKRLIAYFTCKSGAVNLEELAAFMKSKLPDYMIPNAFVALDVFPLTANGKVDRMALPEPEVIGNHSSGRERPWLPIQMQLLRIWETLLNVKEIGLRDSFFTLGGHSLLAARMVDRIERECGIKIPLSTLFSAPTIESLSDYLMSTRKSEGEADVIQVQAGRNRQPFFYLDGDLQGGGFYCLNLARQLGNDQPFYSLRPTTVIKGDGGTIEEQAQQRLARLRSIKPRGPYMLGGFCIDALVAYEMACQLQREGQTVNLLVLVDPPTMPLGLRFGAGLLAGVSHFTGMAQARTLRYFKRCLSLQEIMEMDSARRARYVRQRIKRGLSSTFKRRGPAVIRESDANEGGPRAPFDILTAQLWAAARYRPRQFSGPMSLFVSGDLIEKPAHSPWPWTKRVGRLDVYPVPGEHLELITHNVEILGRELKSCISKAAGCAASGRISECLLSAS